MQLTPPAIEAATKCSQVMNSSKLSGAGYQPAGGPSGPPSSFPESYPSAGRDFAVAIEGTLPITGSPPAMKEPCDDGAKSEYEFAPCSFKSSPPISSSASTCVRRNGAVSEPAARCPSAAVVAGGSPGASSRGEKPDRRFAACRFCDRSQSLGNPADESFESLPLTAAHTREVARLPWHDRDPFDRMLIPQARISNLRFLTADDAAPAYGDPVIHAH